MIVNGNEWTDDEIRSYATEERDLHDPANQEDNPYGRCAHCHYTRHPCSVHDLASMVLALLEPNPDYVTFPRDRALGVSDGYVTFFEGDEVKTQTQTEGNQ